MLSMRREFITPKKAQEMLNLNGFNRDISPQWVDDFANMMRQCRWNYGNDECPVGTIMLDRNGMILDGGNRLTAVVKSGTKGQWFIVQRNVPTENGLLAGTGRPKSFADSVRMYCRMNGRPVPPQLNHLCHALSVYVAHKNQPGRNTLHSLMLHTVRLDAFIKYGKRLQAYVLKANTIRPVMSIGAAAGLWALFADRDPDEADQFMEKLKTGKGIQDGEPVGVLRARLLLDRSRGNRPVRGMDVIERVIRAWNATRAGKRWVRVEANCGEYPVIE